MGFGNPITVTVSVGANATHGAATLAADVSPITVETTVLEKAVNISRTTDVLVMVKAYRTDDSDLDMAWLWARLYRDGVLIEQIVVDSSAGIGPGFVLPAYDPAVPAGPHTYTLKVQPNAGEFGLIAAGGGARTFLAVIEVGTPPA